MNARSLPTPRFLRKTTLLPNERNKNFVMLDDDIVEAISSAEADKVTPLMSKIYLRLKTSPAQFWERTGVLHFVGEIREEKRVKAWDQLCKHLRVSSETAHKALKWMHAQGIIGYSAFKNGVGIRIFLNRAISSIGTRLSLGSKKILPFAPASDTERAASVSEAAFNVPFGDLDDLDTDFNSGAPKNGANTNSVNKISPDPTTHPAQHQRAVCSQEAREIVESAPDFDRISANEVIQRLQNGLETSLKKIAAEAAARAVAGEADRMRVWFETKALPKAVRVAQSESYHLLRKHGAKVEQSRRTRAELEIGRATDESQFTSIAKLLTLEEITEIAETCVALYEVQGKTIEVTLSEISSEAGGWLLPVDAPKIREAAEELLLSRNERT